MFNVLLTITTGTFSITYMNVESVTVSQAVKSFLLHVIQTIVDLRYQTGRQLK